MVIYIFPTTVSTFFVIQMKEAATPLTQDEVTECASLVDHFLIDPDPKAILPVSPDMRMVQGCFRFLKAAYNSKRPRSFGITGSSKSIVDSLTNPPISRPRTEMSPQELLQTINRRDIEISKSIYCPLHVLTLTFTSSSTNRGSC